MGCESVAWICLAGNGDHRWAFVNVVVNPWVP
jgi:hypothetical protein